MARDPYLIPEGEAWLIPLDRCSVKLFKLIIAKERVKKLFLSHDLDREDEAETS